jgi:methionine sulfoxide reductase heme-binding subunit
MTLAVNTAPHLFWITSRAAGTAALFLSSASVTLGLAMGMRLMRGRGTDLRAIHEALSLATVAALLVHGLSLLGDKFLHPSVADIAIPFASGYKTGWTSLGIIAAYALILLGPSYYARRLIGQERWRRWHRFTALAWIAGIVHSFGEGTDAGSAWFVVMVALTTIPAVMLLVLRNFQGLAARQEA